MIIKNERCSLSAHCSALPVLGRSRGTIPEKEVKMMAKYTVSMYLTIEAESEEEAQDIAYNLEILPKRKEDEPKIFWNSQSTEVEEAPF
jgi:hypothetical protein